MEPQQKNMVFLIHRYEVSTRNGDALLIDIIMDHGGWCLKAEMTE